MVETLIWMHLGKLVQVHICGLIATIDVVVKSLWSDSNLIEVKYQISFALSKILLPAGSTPFDTFSQEVDVKAGADQGVQVSSAKVKEKQRIGETS